ncbi:MAG: helix-turn-helix domain-containing protein [Clostridiales bacterium]|nr:helix-turn-helix domain-containing protein [Clostridiales bacterium]
MEEKSTSGLMSELMKSESFDGYIKANNEFLKTQSVSDHINQIIAYKGLARADVAKTSGLNVIYAYQVMAGSRKPTRDKLLCLCKAMGLTVDEVQELLKHCGYAPLYPRRKRDAVILFVWEKSKGILDLNEALFQNGEKTLC